MKLNTRGPSAPIFYTIEEVAEQLGVSLATMRRAIRDGRLATYVSAAPSASPLMTLKSSSRPSWSFGLAPRSPNSGQVKH
jgi:hypothetical protein